MEKILHVDPKNFIPVYDTITEIEREFTKKYIENFELSTHELIETPYIVISPATLQNFVIDIVREYEYFYLDQMVKDLDTFSDFEDLLPSSDESVTDSENN